MRVFLVSIIAVCGLLLAAGSSRAAGPGAAVHKELSTAILHADFAGRAEDVKGTHTHLRHVINCLVGSGGQNYDARAGDPCRGQGHGAVRDAEAAALPKPVRRRLAQALSLSVIALGVTDAEPASHVARAVMALLKEAKQHLPAAQQE